MTPAPRTRHPATPPLHRRARRRLTAALALALALNVSLPGGGAARGDELIDLTPRRIVTQVEGPELERHYFRQGRAKLVFKCPAGVRALGGEREAKFLFEDESRGELLISRSFLDPVETPFFDGNRMDSHYPAVARRQLPPGAEVTDGPNPRLDPFTINDWRSLQFDYAYGAGGDAYRAAVVFLNFDSRNQLILVISALAPEFERVYQRCAKMLNSLHQLRPGEEVEAPPYS